MSREVNAIAGRLSLRDPQRRALEILDRLCEIAPPKKDGDVAAVLKVLQTEYPKVTDFERDFPSLCFALATGVGKTRLMGAFIAYLYTTGRSRNFFVLAPNLTIYDKLIADFTPGTPKYVFQGLSEFATQPPVVITGDNYESGLGVRRESAAPGAQIPLIDSGVHINVFNISKINTDVRASQRGNQPPRIKRLAEYIGESYFDHLAGLPDLVLLMDEAHRYRADAGMKAINELHPILGLELTATPFIESTKGPVWFKNVALSYPLGQAMADGFVKEPAVATRENFTAAGLSDDQLESIKLEDGIRLHERVKTDLRIYANEHDRPVVKPFLLVIAKDTEHAHRLLELIKAKAFFEGRYADRVIEVHSAQSGEEKEETVQRLLAVERADEPTEIVIHVNMLKEGWDVTNLYTIVPLRAANARTLIEQSIGRGLRLPFGKRTGVEAVDTLTIVAHDRFQEIVDEAKKPGSIIQLKQIILDANGPGDAPQPVEVQPLIAQLASGLLTEAEIPLLARDDKQPPSPTFTSPAARAIATTTLSLIAQQTRLPSSRELLKPEKQKELVAAVRLHMPQEPSLPGLAPQVEQVVRELTQAYVKLSIDIPKITVVPKDDVTIGFSDFDLDARDIRLQPVSQEILIHHLQTNQQERLSAIGSGNDETRLEDYVVRALLNYDDVDYDSTADLLYKLTGQLLTHLRSYLPGDDAVKNVLLYYQSRLAALLHGQMESHRWDRPTDYTVTLTAGFRALVPAIHKERPGDKPLLFRVPVESKKDIRAMIFEGFKKCLYPKQRFQSDPERRFSVLLENDKAVEKWVKPAAGNFQITRKGGEMYEPDFVIETTTSLYLAEVKARNEMADPDVLDKARAARVWCERATELTGSSGGKSWRYTLIPDDAIKENLSLEWLALQFMTAEPKMA